MLLELNAGVLQKVYGVFGIHVLREVKLEVELPRCYPRVGKTSLVIEESQSKLDDLQEIDIAAEELILIIRG